MNSIDLKDEVRRAIDSAWPAFVQRHPHLAAAIDQQLLVEQAASCIADDPDLQAAMAQATAAGLAASVLKDLICRLATRWMRNLL